MSIVRTLATVFLFAITFSFISTAVYVGDAFAEQKGRKDSTWEW